MKLPLLLDHDGHLPSFAVVTEGKQHEVRVAGQLHFVPGTILVIDRGYADYEWFARLSEERLQPSLPPSLRKNSLLRPNEHLDKELNLGAAALFHNAANNFW